MTRKYHKSRPQHLLRKVLSYNVDNALKLASKGKHPFPLSSISDVNTSSDPVLAWDYESLPVSRESALYATPFSCNSVEPLFVKMADGTISDLNATTDGFNSQLSTVSQVVKRIRSDPDSFTMQCKRIVRVIGNNVPKPEVLANLNSESLALSCIKVEKGVKKLDSYVSILEEYLTADEPTSSEEKMRSLEHLHGSLTSSLLDLRVALTNLEKIREDVEREEKQKKMVEAAGVDRENVHSSQSCRLKTARSVTDIRVDNPEIGNLFAQNELLNSRTVFVPVRWRLPGTESSESSGNLCQTQCSESWRNVDHDPTSIVEMLKVDEMKQVKEIIDSTSLEDKPDEELLNLEEKEIKDLKKVRNQMMERLVKMEGKGNWSSSFQRIHKSVMSALKEAREWMVMVARLMKELRPWKSRIKFSCLAYLLPGIFCAL